MEIVYSALVTTFCTRVVTGHSSRPEYTASGPVVGASELRGTGLLVAEAAHELAQIDDVLGSFRQGDDFGLAGGQGDALLLPRAPVKRGAMPKHCPPGCRGSGLP